jgi:hypothetical protein
LADGEQFAPLVLGEHGQHGQPVQRLRQIFAHRAQQAGQVRGHRADRGPLEQVRVVAEVDV